GRARAEAFGAYLRALPYASRRRPRPRRDVRGPGAQPQGATRARHDHGAGGAGEHSRGVPRNLGARGPRRSPRRPRHRRSRRLPGKAQRDAIRSKHMRKGPSIAIIGAGIGGLAVAAALRQVGFDATVYEQAAAFARVGSGIQQSPNAVKVHRGLGIEERLRATAFAPTSSLNREALTGKVSNDHPLGRVVEERYGAP